VIGHGTAVGENPPMLRSLSLSALWLLAVWTWVNMAHAFLGTPDIGFLAGLLAAGMVFAIRNRNAEPRTSRSMSTHSKPLTTSHS
jgi:hypothetical protein